MSQELSLLKMRLQAVLVSPFLALHLAEQAMQSHVRLQLLAVLWDDACRVSCV